MFPANVSTAFLALGKVADERRTPKSATHFTEASSPDGRRTNWGCCTRSWPSFAAAGAIQTDDFWLGMRGDLGFVPTAIRYPKLSLDYVDSWLDPPSFAICHGPLRRSLSYDGVV
ncbi:hypothetical protein A9K55_002112 [Cordyceps militaris]|uniref:Uncharacterized protein n=1 Tax=Cordyceps militaris TaxID=73501 RepID=A0A2H4SRB0_CORMI|nr:hypothetical protein A9K55_002112 [Cordyceps militaris]